MKKQFKLIAGGFLIFLLVTILNNCSAGNTDNQSNLANDVIDSISETIAENVVETMFADDSTVDETQPEIVTKASVEEPQAKFINEITDFIIADSKLYAVFNDGLVVYDIESKTQKVLRNLESLKAIVEYQGKIYVGGDYLYQYQDGVLEYVDDLSCQITCLYDYNGDLMIGTADGLYTRGIMGKERLFDGGAITALCADNDGLWVATDGNGLYRWDGDKFKKRYLIRDENLFDNVRTLDFKNNHLYAGSDNGFHIFDGGSWTTLTQKEGLPGDDVIDIDASGWVIYIATADGVISYFNGDFIQVEKLNEKRANVIVKNGAQIMVATDHEGIIVKTGKTVNTLVQPLEDMNLDLLSLAF